jgi:ATPase subunit of ABC transporter with duplicated ATPase domains
LAAQPAACIAVSHDERFLEDFATRVFEIERGEFHDYSGGWDFYLHDRETRLASERAAYERQRQHRAALERASERRHRLAASVAKTPKGQRDARGGTPFYQRKAGKVARTARLLRERLDAEPAAAKPWDAQPIPDLTFRDVPRCPDPCLDLANVSKSFGGKPVLHGLTFQCRRNQRWALYGPNGSGKTTLLRLLLGRELPDSGQVRIAPGVRLAYYAQEADTLDPSLSSVENCPGENQWVRTLLACLKLPRVLMDQPVGALSPGERAKTALTRILVEGGNVLLLDEPTNHLELEAQHALARTLRAYPAAMILVSHDRRFLEECTDHVLDLGGDWLS